MCIDTDDNKHCGKIEKKTLQTDTAVNDLYHGPNSLQYLQMRNRYCE